MLRRFGQEQGGEVDKEKGGGRAQTEGVARTRKGECMEERGRGARTWDKMLLCT